MEAHKIKMDRLESIIDDHGKELANLKDRVREVKKKGCGISKTSATKTDLDILKKEVASLWSTDLSAFIDALKDPSLKMDMATILDEGVTIDVMGDVNEEN